MCKILYQRKNNDIKSEAKVYENGEEQRRDNREVQELFRNSSRTTNKQGNDTEILADKKRRKTEQKQIKEAADILGTSLNCSATS